MTPPEERFAYAVSISHTDTPTTGPTFGFRVRGDGVLTPLPARQPAVYAGDAARVVVSRRWRCLYGASADGKAILRYTVGADGGLRLAESHRMPYPPGRLVLHPSGKWLYVTTGYVSGWSVGEAGEPSLAQRWADVLRFAVGPGGALTPLPPIYGNVTYAVDGMKYDCVAPWLSFDSAGTTAFVFQLSFSSEWRARRLTAWRVQTDGSFRPGSFRRFGGLVDFRESGDARKEADDIGAVLYAGDGYAVADADGYCAVWNYAGGALGRKRLTLRPASPPGEHRALNGWSYDPASRLLIGQEEGAGRDGGPVRYHGCAYRLGRGGRSARRVLGIRDAYLFAGPTPDLLYAVRGAGRSEILTFRADPKTGGFRQTDARPFPLPAHATQLVFA
jgi:hypothetical protein